MATYSGIYTSYGFYNSNFDIISVELYPLNLIQLSVYTGSPVSIYRRKLRTCRDIIFCQQYVIKTVHNNFYCGSSAMAGRICFNAFNEPSEGVDNPFIGVSDKFFFFVTIP